jgi:D-alanine--poly(phosphoribitol) ligase subunit 1
MRSLFARIASMPTLDRPAVVGEHGTLAWSELLDRARGLALRLDPVRAPVVLYGHKEPAMVVGMVAALTRGRPYVPVDPVAPPGRIARMIDAAQPTDAVLTHPAPAELVRELAARGIRTIALDPLATDVAARDAHAAIPTPSPVGPETLAYVLFTSGTTGEPKGVPIPHRALVHFIDWLLATHEFVPGGETFLNQAPFSFDLSVMDLYGALTTGGTLFTLGRDELADARRLFARLDGAPLTVWVSTPSFAHVPRGAAVRAPMLPSSAASSLRRDAAGRRRGSRFPAPGLEHVRSTGRPSRDGGADHAGDGGDRSALPVGRPAPGVDVWIAVGASAVTAA